MPVVASLKPSCRLNPANSIDLLAAQLTDGVGRVVNRLKGRMRSGQNKTSFIALDQEKVAEIVVASKAGRKWRSYEDAILIAAGAEESVELDAQLAAQLGRTPSAVRARRAKLKKMGRL